MMYKELCGSRKVMWITTSENCIILHIMRKKNVQFFNLQTTLSNQTQLKLQLPDVPSICTSKSEVLN